MKVFGIGLPKTGTTSLTRALDLLGFRPALHNPWDPREIGACGSATDITIASRFRALAKIWPDARFIFTTRTLADWLDSSERHYHCEAPRHADVDLDLPEYHHYWFAREAYIEVYGSRQFERAAWAHVYRNHESQVRAHFSRMPHRLLTLPLCSEGMPGAEKWRRLCQFLGVDVPEGVEFPWENRSQ